MIILMIVNDGRNWRSRRIGNKCRESWTLTNIVAGLLARKQKFAMFYFHDRPKRSQRKHKSLTILLQNEVSSMMYLFYLHK